MTGTIHIIDDDPELAESLRFLFEAHRLHARVHPGAEHYLGLADPEPGCLVLDLRMPGMGGLGLLEALNAAGRLPPTIVLTGHGEVRAAVRAMQLGAVEFLTKPHDSDELLRLVRDALDAGVAAAAADDARRAVLERISTLTPRERDVLDGLLAGGSSRAIGEVLGLQTRSVEVYRVRILGKLGFGSSIELVGAIARSCPELVAGAPVHLYERAPEMTDKD